MTLAELLVKLEAMSIIDLASTLFWLAGHMSLGDEKDWGIFCKAILRSPCFSEEDKE